MFSSITLQQHLYNLQQLLLVKLSRQSTRQLYSRFCTIRYDTIR